MLKSYSDLSDTPYFSRELFERVEKALAGDGVDPSAIWYQFVARPDLEGIPYMLCGSVRVKDDENG